MIWCKEISDRFSSFLTSEFTYEKSKTKEIKQIAARDGIRLKTSTLATPNIIQDLQTYVRDHKNDLVIFEITGYRQERAALSIGNSNRLLFI